MITVETLYSIFQQYPVISTDTRNIIPGSLFFALKGQNFDGNTFAGFALQQGAAFAIIDNPLFCIDSRYILTDNVLSTLQKLAVYHRRNLKTKVIGITGTNGKTTTKELILSVLKQKFNALATIGNLNNHIGVPLTLLKIDTETEFVVVEMGANHLGEIEELCNIALPEFGIITNIGKAHLEGFGSIEGIIETKSALYKHVASIGGTVFVNCDNLLLMNLSNKQTIITYGSKSEADCRCGITVPKPFLGMKWYSNDDILIQTQLAGIYNFENVMAAICIGNYFGVEPGKIKEAIVNYTPTNNRSQQLNTRTNNIILDYYNANPSSMEASIVSFNNPAADNNVLILGDMFELGKYAEGEHKKIIELVKSLHFNKVILAGAIFNSVSEGSGLISLRDCESAIRWLIENPVTDSNILIKGSRGMKMECLLEYL